MSEDNVVSTEFLSPQNIFPVTNATGVSSSSESTYEKIIIVFWMGVVLYLGLGLLALIGNGLVLYTSFGDLNMGPLRHLDNVIKSLAVADMLYGLLGVPCKVVADYYVGKRHFIIAFIMADVSSLNKSKILIFHLLIISSFSSIWRR